MASRLETYRVEAYNTAKLSENKMHDDTVAKRFGFSGGLVPGVDVMAYMMHMPVMKWGRGFLEHGLIEARFVKPVYDGETAASERGRERRRADDRGRKPRGNLRHRQRVAAVVGAVIRARRFHRGRRGQGAQAGKHRVRIRSANGSAPCRATGPARRRADISPISGRPIRSMPAKNSAIPASCSG